MLRLESEEPTAWCADMKESRGVPVRGVDPAGIHKECRLQTAIVEVELVR